MKNLNDMVFLRTSATCRHVIIASEQNVPGNSTSLSYPFLAHVHGLILSFPLVLILFLFLSLSLTLSLVHPFPSLTLPVSCLFHFLCPLFLAFLFSISSLLHTFLFSSSLPLSLYLSLTPTLSPSFSLARSHSIEHESFCIVLRSDWYYMFLFLPFHVGETLSIQPSVYFKSNGLSVDIGTLTFHCASLSVCTYCA